MKKKTKITSSLLACQVSAVPRAREQNHQNLVCSGQTFVQDLESLNQSVLAQNSFHMPLPVKKGSGQDI